MNVVEYVRSYRSDTVNNAAWWAMGYATGTRTGISSVEATQFGEFYADQYEAWYKAAVGGDESSSFPTHNVAMRQWLAKR